jgi:hypothetical protein
MTDNENPTNEVETESAGIEAILADDQSAPVEAQAPVQEAAPEAKPEAKPEAEQPFWYRKQIE